MTALTKKGNAKKKKKIKCHRSGSLRLEGETDRQKEIRHRKYMVKAEMLRMH